jgi:hypothetical protein
MTFDLQSTFKAAARFQLLASVTNIRNEQTRSGNAAPRAMEAKVHFSKQSITRSISGGGGSVDICIHDRSTGSIPVSAYDISRAYGIKRSNELLAVSIHNDSRAYCARRAGASFTVSIDDATCASRAYRSSTSLAISIDDTQSHIS